MELIPLLLILGTAPESDFKILTLLRGYLSGMLFRLKVKKCLTVRRHRVRDIEVESTVIGIELFVCRFLRLAPEDAAVDKLIVSAFFGLRRFQIPALTERLRHIDEQFMHGLTVRADDGAGIVLDPVPDIELPECRDNARLLREFHGAPEAPGFPVVRIQNKRGSHRLMVRLRGEGREAPAGREKTVLTGTGRVLLLRIEIDRRDAETVPDLIQEPLNKRESFLGPQFEKCSVRAEIRAVPAEVLQPLVTHGKEVQPLKTRARIETAILEFIQELEGEREAKGGQRLREELPGCGIWFQQILAFRGFVFLIIKAEHRADGVHDLGKALWLGFIFERPDETASENQLAHEVIKVPRLERRVLTVIGETEELPERLMFVI